MYKHIAFALALSCFLLPLASCADTSDLAGEPRTGTINLSGSTGTDFYYNLLFIIPIVIAIILLDFAIFGAFATRSDELNPISRFFYHAREGLAILRSRRRNSPYGHNRISPARPPHNLVAR